MSIRIFGKNKNNLTVHERLSRLEGQVSVMLLLTIGTFVGVLGLLLERAFA